MAAISGPNIPLDGLVFNMDPASALSYPARNDPYRDQISLLLDGTSFTDKSRNNFTITPNGNSSISNSVKLFDNSSYYFDGNGDYLTLNSNSFTFGTSDFTIDMWVYPTQSVIGCGLLSEIFTGSGRVELSIFTGITGALGTNYQLGVGHYNGSSWQYVINSGVTLTNNQWSHIRVTRLSGTLYLFINGSLTGSGSFPVDIGAGNGWLLARRWDTYSSAGQWPYYYGYMSNIVIWKGVCLGINNFTPPSKIISFPSIIKDIKNDVLGTFTNGPVYSSTQKGIVSFIGANVGSAGTSIRFSNNSTYDVQSSNFSICAWCNPKEQLNYGIIAGKWGGYGVSNLKSFALRQDNGQHFQFGISSNGSTETLVTNSATFSLGEWYHICATRDGNNVYLYTNGVVTSSGSFSGSVYTSSTDFTVGAANNNTDTFKGNISDVKLYNRGLSSNEVKKMYTATRERFVEIPKTISGLQLWLDAADLSTLRQNSNGTTAVALASDPIGYWADKSGNGRNVLQATSSYRPTLSISSMNMVQFNGTSHYIELASTLSLSDMTIFWIGILDESPSNGTAMFHGANTSDSLNMYLAGYYWYQTSDILQGANSSWSISQLTLSELSRLSGTWNVKHNNITKTATLNSSTSAVIKGMGKAYSGYSQMRVGEILIYNTYLSEYDRSIIKNYLNKKWGVF